MNHINPCLELARHALRLLHEYHRDHDTWTDYDEMYQPPADQVVVNILLENEQLPAVLCAGNWPKRAPDAQTWSGKQTLERLVQWRCDIMRGKRLKGVSKAQAARMAYVPRDWESCEDPLHFRCPLPGAMLRIDPDSEVPSARDLGYSLAAITREEAPLVATYIVRELLALYALALVPLVSFAPREVGVILPEGTLRWPVEADGNYGYHKWMPGAWEVAR